jgi:hypothetical protein
MNKIQKIIVVLTAIFLITPVSSFAQGGDRAFQNKLESILSQFKNYRFSTISVYRVNEISEIRKLLKARKQAQSAGNVDLSKVNEIKEKVGNDVYNAICSGAKANQSTRKIKQTIDSRGWDLPSSADLEAIYLSCKSSGPVTRVRNIYAVTTRAETPGALPETIIGVMVVYEDEDLLADQLGSMNAKNVYTYPELRREFTDDEKGSYGVNDFYGLVMNAFIQENVQDVTLEAQGIGTDLLFAPRSAGNTSNIVASSADIKDSDIQSLMRISDGLPLDMKNKKNEVVVGPDKISWKMYEYMIYQDEDFTDTLSSITNLNMPKIGFEIKYGQEEINYPSLWSEKMHARFTWQNIKLGMVLPTSGWSGLASEVFDIERKLTSAGAGLSAEFDFPVRIIPESGVFSFKGNYVFGDATEATFTEDIRKDMNFGGMGATGFVGNDPANDYLIRFSSQLHYTFAIAIDDDLQMRFGLGGTIYSAENWGYKGLTSPDSPREFLQIDDETIGGVSAKLDFMVKSKTTPFGGSIQYFDSGLFADVWLQVPIIENTFSARISGKGFIKAFDDPRAWEVESVLIPSVSAIMFF